MNKIDRVKKAIAAEGKTDAGVKQGTAMKLKKKIRFSVGRRSFRG